MKKIFDLQYLGKITDYSSVVQIGFTDELKTKEPCLFLVFKNDSNGEIKNRLKNRIGAIKRCLESDAQPSLNFTIDDTTPNCIRLKGNLVNALDVLQRAQLVDKNIINKFREELISNGQQRKNLGSFIDDSKNFVLESEEMKAPFTLFGITSEKTDTEEVIILEIIKSELKANPQKVAQSIIARLGNVNPDIICAFKNLEIGKEQSKNQKLV